MKKKKVRRTQEQRRIATREKVARAALDTLLDVGYAEFTTVKVAARAGVSRGAQENHFPTRLELIGAAARLVMEQAASDARSMASRAEKSHRILETYLEDAQAFFFSSSYFAMTELAFGAKSDRQLAEVHGQVVRDF